MPWAATLLARSQLLEGSGGPYFGSARGYVSSLTPATKRILKRIFGYALRIFQKFLRFRASVDFVGLCVLASPEDRFRGF